MAVQRGFRLGDGSAASPPYKVGPLETDTPIVFNEPVVDSYKRYVLEYNFEKLPQANADIDQVYTVEAARASSQHFEVLGTNAVSGDVTFAATIGGIQLETNTGGSDQVIILPHLDTNATPWQVVKWGTENQVIWEAVIRTGASVADIIIWAGLKLTNTSVIATDDDQAMFRFSAAADTFWNCIASTTDSDVAKVTTVTVSASTNYYFKIAIDSDRKPHFSINNKEVFVGAALANDIDLIPYVGVQNETTSAKIINLVKTKISRIIFE